MGVIARKAEVFALLADGLTTERIVTRLSISPRTVNKHVAVILDNLSGRSRLEAASLLVARRRLD